MEDKKFVLKLTGYIMFLIGSLSLGFVRFAKGNVDEWFLNFVGVAGAILLINAAAILLISVRK
jgi:hypothetical protein